MAFLFALLFGFFSNAQQAPSTALGFHNETDVGITLVGGNSNTESYAIKQLNSYGGEKYVFKARFRYLAARLNGTDSARNWDGELRYERVLSETLNVFAAHSLESNLFAGFVQRNNFDLGVKYYFAKNEFYEWFGELGYRYIFTDFISTTPDTTNHAARIYSEFAKKFGETSEFKIWAEYVPSFTNTQDYLLNGEPSISFLMGELFSLKLAYLFKYHSIIPANLTNRLDTVFTTSIVAKF